MFNFLSRKYNFRVNYGKFNDSLIGGAGGGEVFVEEIMDNGL